MKKNNDKKFICIYSTVCLIVYSCNYGFFEKMISQICNFYLFEKKMHEVELVSMDFKSLEEKVSKLIKASNKDNLHFKIFDNNGQEIINDQQLKRALEIQPIFFFIHSFVYYCYYYFHLFILKKFQKEECHKIINPLVLLTGDAKYKNKDSLLRVKIDLMMFQNLFEKNMDIKCGHGSTNNGEDILITSDDKSQIFKSIQDLFTHKTKVFLNKPKIFIKNACRGNEPPEPVKRGTQWYNKESDTLIIFPTTIGKQIYDSMGPEKGSYFTNYFCDVMIQNISSPKSLEDNLKIISKLILKNVNTEQLIEYVSTLDQQVFFYNKNISKNK
ncbi:hypothetical protein RFI_30807 [Reticulomyxa filosa]|uniref:Caspase family p20 domain-containing protein n=1 Tax=Reticulomyxa filosa TaxID=46433 RepID=X6M0S9_RETFI|nr:hypothetical protein RFI_30807 [Reticulomyxa filosa]|eukprot:ETO06585.1 hypothetical protein RFI_30807 [Reticulomyxa filosa]